MKSVAKIVNLILQAGALMQLPRSQIRHLGVPEDVSSHSFLVSVLAYTLSRTEGLSHVEGQTALGMAVFHDLVEARTGDFGFVEKHYNKINEEKAVKDQFSEISFGRDLAALIKEFELKETTVSKCVKDADSLAQLYSEWNLMWQGNRLAEKWFESDFKDRVPSLRTESAKKLAHAMKESNPHEWWWSQFVSDDKAIRTDLLLGKDKS